MNQNRIAVRQCLLSNDSSYNATTSFLWNSNPIRHSQGHHRDAVHSRARSIDIKELTRELPEQHFSARQEIVPYLLFGFLISSFSCLLKLEKWVCWRTCIHPVRVSFRLHACKTCPLVRLGRAYRGQVIDQVALRVCEGLVLAAAPAASSWCCFQLREVVLHLRHRVYLPVFSQTQRWQGIMLRRY